MHIHNRMRFAIAGALIALTLIGAGCGSASKPPAGTPSAPTDGATNVPSDSTDTDAGAITNWATYRSESLGITIPYPEGWYVEEDVERGSVGIAEHAPPESSDEPSRIFMQRFRGSIDDFASSLDNVETDSIVTIGNAPRRRLVLRTDRFEDEGYVEMYLWEMGEVALRVSGLLNDPLLEDIITRMEVQR